MNIWGLEKKINSFKMRRRNLEAELKHAHRFEKDIILTKLNRVKKKIENWKFKLEDYRKKHNKKGKRLNRRKK